MRDKVQKHSEARQRHPDLNCTHDQRQKEGEFEIVGSTHLGQTSQSGEHHQGYGCCWAGDEVRGASPQAGSNGWDDRSVKPVLNGKSGDERIGHGLRNCHHSHGETGNNIRPPIALAVIPHPKNKRCKL